MIGDKIRKLRNENGLTQQELADKLNISSSTIGMYEQNRRLPDVNIVIKISELFNITSDYLLGIEHISNLPIDKNSGYTTTKFEMDTTFSERFDLLYRESGLSNEAEEKALNLHHNQIIDIQYNRMPTLSEILKIASFFQVSIDYLLGRTNFKDAILADEEELLLYYAQLNKLDKRFIMGKIAGLIKAKEETSVAAEDNLLYDSKNSSPSNGTEGMGA